MSEIHTAPAWSHGWWHGAEHVESLGAHNADEISRLPSGEYITDLWAREGYLRHGPVETIEEARACSAGRCNCWRAEVKRHIAQRRHDLQRQVNAGCIPGATSAPV